MENVKQVKNTEPAVMTDSGPYGSSRVKSKDGRYTANPNAAQKQDPGKGADSFSANKTNYSDKDTNFDTKIATPLFATAINERLLPIFSANREKGQKTVFTQSTEYEDNVLGIDYFLGNAGQNENLIDEPDVDKIDLKTIKSGIGHRDFFDHPKITLTLKKMHVRNNGKITDMIKKHINTHFAFQVLYSDKNIKDVSSADDITEAKLYYTEKPALVKYLNDSITIENDVSTIFARRDLTSLEIKNQLSELATKNGYEFNEAYDKFHHEKIYQILNSKDGTGLRLHEESSGDRQVRVVFPTKAFIDNPKLKKATIKSYYQRKQNKI